MEIKILVDCAKFKQNWRIGNLVEDINVNELLGRVKQINKLDFY